MASHFNAVDALRRACKQHGIPIAEAALRWLRNHSLLKDAREDGIVLGVTALDHLRSNLDACEGGALPEEIVRACDKAWEIARFDGTAYFP